jgi:hypothetical protein
MIPLLLVAIPVLLFVRGRRAAAWGLGFSALFLIVLVLALYLPGLPLYLRAMRGEPAAQYQYARWTETQCERIGAIILWPCEPNVLGGYRWLERAAAQDYPPAVYLVGVRLKHGIHVPRPQGWTGPGGNVFSQPERGQAMIDRAVNELGFGPAPDEQTYYWQVYRRGY